MVNKHKQKKKKTFKTYGKSDKELNTLIEKKFQKFVQNKKRRKTEKELQQFQEIHISDNERKISISSFAKSVESREVSSSSFEWKIDLHKLFVTCLNGNSDKIAKSIIYYLYLFINTSLNHMSTRSRLVLQDEKVDLVSQPNNK